MTRFITEYDVTDWRPEHALEKVPKNCYGRLVPESYDNGWGKATRVMLYIYEREDE